VKINLGADDGLNGRLDVFLGVVSGLAGDNAVLLKSRGKIIALDDVHGSVPVVEITLCAIVDGRSASTMLLSFIKNKLAALKRRPQGIKILLKRLIVEDAIQDILTSVGTSAAFRVVLSFIIGPHSVHSEARRSTVDIRRQLAAAIIAESARPRFHKNHISPIIL